MFISLIKRLTVCLSVFVMFSANAKTINLPGKSEDKFPNVLIEAAIERGGIYSVAYPDADQFINMSRQVAKAESGDYNLIWTLTSREYEERLIPIRIPIYRGMLGMRVGIVRDDQTELFANVRSMNDLRQFRAGQGTLWADTPLLEANGIPVVKEMKYPNLFPMLEGGRFEYFPRGIHEPWAEIVANEQYNLTVEPYVLMRYIAPFYYFVSKQNPEIAVHITEQLEEMIDDGSFEEMFFADQQVRDALDNANLKDRRVFELNNPNLTAETPLDRKELWFDPMSSTR